MSTLRFDVRVMPPGEPAAQRAQLGISDGLIRLSVGIEDLEDQRHDLRKALAAI